ncbi:MAG: hypothetical protein CMH61_01665 [Nanoarchaeota archaeon]|nr:hypothetical protein [Nanoarchaeota archaeon]|tara:strand:+ start:3321 stop:4361 length:1041 start_codon:yes stop_codon:yes gene_type:complete
MSILSKRDLLDQERKGNVVIPDREEFSAFSLDMKIGRLFKRKPGAVFETPGPFDDEETEAEFVTKYLEEIEWNGEVIVGPNNQYWYYPQEDIFLAEGLAGKITSRSSWARLAARTENQEEQNYLRNFTQEVWVNPLCTLGSTGTSYVIEQGSAVGQLFVHDGLEHCTVEEVQDLISGGDFVIERKGKRLSVDDVDFWPDGHSMAGIVLTKGPDLLVYDGSILRKGNSDQHFTKVSLENGSYPAAERQFFLSASAETISLPNGYVGDVKERIAGTLPAMITHANAPYIGPSSVFEGTITFENCMLLSYAITEGMPFTTLNLIKLRTPINGGSESRYKGQQGATASRL